MSEKIQMSMLQHAPNESVWSEMQHLKGRVVTMTYFEQ